MAGGRPTKYTPEIIACAKKYVETGWREDGDSIPSIEGLVDYLDKNDLAIRRSTVYEWQTHEDKEEFSDILDKILSKQSKELINQGLKGDFNSTITKLILTKHGYSDKVDNKLSGDADAPIETNLTVKFID